MKEFLRPTRLKIGLTGVFLVFYFIEKVLLLRIMAYNLSPTEDIEKVNIWFKIINLFIFFCYFLSCWISFLIKKEGRKN